MNLTEDETHVMNHYENEGIMPGGGQYYGALKPYLESMHRSIDVNTALEGLIEKGFLKASDDLTYFFLTSEGADSIYSKYPGWNE